MQTLEQVTDWLESKGFRKYRNTPARVFDLDYILCKTYREFGVPDCQCNDKPPQIVVELYRFEFHNQSPHQCIKLEITGADSSGQWPHISYSLQLNEIEENFDKLVEKLYGAWAQLF